MKILVLTHYYWPHIGGVEKHVQKVNLGLIKRGHEITVVTERYNKKLVNEETKDGVKIIRLEYPHIKFIGLLSIWFWLFKNRDLIKKGDIVQIHDVFIWYLPLRFLYFKKPVYTTVHGFEWERRYSKWSLLQKRLAVKLSSGSIGIGKYLEKHIGVKFTKIIYGGTN